MLKKGIRIVDSFTNKKIELTKDNITNDIILEFPDNGGKLIVENDMKKMVESSFLYEKSSILPSENLIKSYLFVPINSVGKDGLPSDIDVWWIDNLISKDVNDIKGRVYQTARGMNKKGIEELLSREKVNNEWSPWYSVSSKGKIEKAEIIDGNFILTINV